MKNDGDHKPLDPTTAADDLMGDTSGRTGITTNKTQSDTAQGSGTVANTTSGTPDATLDQKDFGPRSLSDAMTERSEDVASEEEKERFDGLHLEDDDLLSPSRTGHSRDLVASGNESQEDAERDITTSEAGNTQEKDLGEEDIVGGSAPVTGVGSDVGDMAKQVGLDYDTDNNGDGYENDELNIAAKIDQAEKALRES